MSGNPNEREQLAQKIRDIVIEHNGYLATASVGQPALAMANEIDRAIADAWLADRERVQAQAWDEGFETGDDYGHRQAVTPHEHGMTDPPLNPYATPKGEQDA